MQMDLWVVAAATGAGYLAKYWKNVLGDNKQGSSGVPSGHSALVDEHDSRSLNQSSGDKSWARGHFLGTDLADQFRDEAGKGDHSGGLFGEASRSDAGYASLMENEREYDKYNEYRDDYRVDDDIPEHQTWKMTANYSSRKSSECLRSRRLKRLPLQYIKPRTSLDSFVMAQMRRECVDMEEYLRTPLSSPCTRTFRPFIVTDGRRVISRPSGDFRHDLNKEEVLPKTDNEVVGIPRLPQVVTTGNSTKMLSNDKNQMHAKKSTQLFTRDGFSSGKVLFCFGISVGVMSTLIANKVEVAKLEARLKQSENLVEDLQEELEMKDSLIVKELANDDDSQDILASSCGHENIDLISNQADTVSLEKGEALNRIEAELEAELERLELSMKGSMLREISSDAIEELDQDLSAELVHGELNADIFGGRSSSEPTPDRGETPQWQKDCVSPRELSLRLHEVIESRLQERIMELETELAKSQKRIQDLESEKNSWREISQSESSSNLGSPMANPLVMNLSGDALDAYNEVFSELDKSNGFPEGKDSWIKGDNEKQNVVPAKAMDDKLTGFESGGNQDDGNPIDFDGGSGNNNDDDDDDDDFLLIKQIVEKARQGSPAILKAQRSLIWSNVKKN